MTFITDNFVTWQYLKIDAQMAEEQQTIQTLQAELIQMKVGHHTSDFKQKLQEKQGQ